MDTIEVSRRPSIASITNLQAVKGARRAAYVLAGLLHEPPWVRDIRVVTSEGYPHIEVRLADATERSREQARMCVPTAVNSVKVRVVAPGRGSR